MDNCSAVENKSKSKTKTENRISIVGGQQRRTQEVEANSVSFSLLAIGFQAVVLALIGVFFEYGSSAAPNATFGAFDSGAIAIKLIATLSTATFLFVGLGLHAGRAGSGVTAQSASGFALLFGAAAVEWALLVNGFWRCVSAAKWSMLQLDLDELLRAELTAFSVSIALACGLGALSVSQLCTVAVLGVVVQGLNRMVVEDVLYAADAGGTLSVHVFGAAFGLGVACVAARRAALRSKGARVHPDGDSLSMIGSVFLWIHFIGANVALAPAGPPLVRAAVNTALALIGSAVTAFAFSHWARPGHRFRVGDIQAAAVAGGVAMGAAGPMAVWPAGALTIGVAAGIAAVGCEVKIAPLLRRLGVHDAAGVHSSFGVPAVVGAAGAIVASSLATTAVYGSSQLALVFPAIARGHSASAQSLLELAALGVSIAFGIIAGILTGAMISAPVFTRRGIVLFPDKQHWHPVSPSLADGGGASGDIRLEPLPSGQPSPAPDPVQSQASPAAPAMAAAAIPPPPPAAAIAATSAAADAVEMQPTPPMKTTATALNREGRKERKPSPMAGRRAARGAAREAAAVADLAPPPEVAKKEADDPPAALPVGEAMPLTAAALRRSSVPAPPTEEGSRQPPPPPATAAPPAYTPATATPAKAAGAAVFKNSPAGPITPAAPAKGLRVAAAVESDSEIERTAGESYHSDEANLSPGASGISMTESESGSHESSGRNLSDADDGDDSHIATGTRTQTRTLSQSLPDDEAGSGSESRSSHAEKRPR